MEKFINDAKDGDVNAFTKLIYDIRIDLYKIARTRLSSSEDIEDAVQETIIEAFKSLKSLRQPQYFKKWIIKILVNKCNKIYKYKKRYNISFEELEVENFIGENSIEKTDNFIEFDLMLKSLNYDEKIATVLYYLEDYTTKEISKILKTSENTIKSRLRRAKIKMKKDYERRNQ